MTALDDVAVQLFAISIKVYADPVCNACSDSSNLLVFLSYICCHCVNVGLTFTVFMASCDVMLE